ncbi:MAG: cobaltochelatase subunit CobN [Rhodomicrobium sp.]
MCRIKRFGQQFLLGLLLICSGTALAGQANVSLLLGDTDSLTAIEAVRELRSDPRLSDFVFHVFSTRQVAEGDLTALARSRVVFIQTVGRNLALGVAPQIREMISSGGKAYAVGTSWNKELEELGLSRDEELARYMNAGGPRNVANMVRAGLQRELGMKLDAATPEAAPEFGALDLTSGRIASSFADFRDHMSDVKPGRPWIGIAFYRSNAVSGQTAVLRALAGALEQRGYNVIPFFGFPNEPTLERFAFGEGGKPALAALGALSLKISSNPATLGPLLQKIGAPVVNLITLNSQSFDQWQASPQGLDIVERSWQVGSAEYGGLVAPTVIGTKERWHAPDTGLDAVLEKPIVERIERAADRLAAYARLRELPNQDKKIALIYFNYPPGKETIGASYLNVLPGSLMRIIQRLSAEGYATQGMPAAGNELLTAIRDHGGNIGNWNQGTLDSLVRDGIESGTVQLLPVSAYEQWFLQDVPASLRDAMIAKWGDPKQSNIMVWRDASRRPYFVFPVQRYGNILLAPQPSRGWEQNVESLYHDTALPPHHQYLAFYLWLQHEFHADAMIHVGTHATHEWLSGKEVGLSNADPGDIVTGATPQFYPYIVDDVGEAIQAKRRGMATIISHMIPPLDRASLNPQLREIAQLISDQAVAAEKSPQIAEGLLAEIEKKAKAQGLLKDLGAGDLRAGGALDRLDDYIREIQEKVTPFGLHTFGEAPDGDAQRKSAEAIASVDRSLDPVAREKSIASLMTAMEQSAKEELGFLVAGLAGRYVPAGPGNDPVRTPASLPTGRDLYGFDPSRLPTPAAWAIGEKLAHELVEDFHRRRGAWPEKYVFNLWGVESTRHEGVMEAQIMTLLGVRPKWDARGKILGLEAIARADLGRPRVDVTVIPSGLYRDMFPQAMKLLDDAVSLAKAQDEADNRVRSNIRAMRDALIATGLSEQRAEQLASVRLFTVPSGAYGTNLDKAIPLSNTYGSGQEADAKLADLYFIRMHHAFGQGLWGESIEDRPGLGVDLLKGALKGAQGVVHSRSSNVYAALDGDDFYQYLGGTALAIRSVNGATPEVLVTDMANPKAAKNETLERYIGREMRSRYLNPKWIEAMMKEGYAGAAFMSRVVENLYGWQVTVPEAVGDGKWQEMYETWVKDRDHLGIVQKFRDAKNLLAYQAIVDRMLVAVNKGYWKASPETVAELNGVNRAVIDEAGVSCYRDTCSSPEIAALAEKQDQKAAEAANSAPAPSPGQIAANIARGSANADPAPETLPHAQAAGGGSARVEGYLMEEKTKKASGSAPSAPLAGKWFLLAAALAGFLSRFPTLRLRRHRI